MLRFLHMADLHLGADFNTPPVDKQKKHKPISSLCLKLYCSGGRAGTSGLYLLQATYSTPQHPPPHFFTRHVLARTSPRPVFYFPREVMTLNRPKPLSNQCASAECLCEALR